jgi:hypothetical protein
VVSDWLYFLFCGITIAPFAILLRALVALILRPVGNSRFALIVLVLAINGGAYVIATSTPTLVTGGHMSPLWWLMSLGLSVIAALGIANILRDD